MIGKGHFYQDECSIGSKKNNQTKRCQWIVEVDDGRADDDDGSGDVGGSSWGRLLVEFVWKAKDKHVWMRNEG